jgi:hypothetical protein
VAVETSEGIWQVLVRAYDPTSKDALDTEYALPRLDIILCTLRLVWR